MLSAFSIVVPIDIQRTSPNQRLHWAERNRRNQSARNAAQAAWVKAGRPKCKRPVTVELIVRRGRVLDADNAVSSTKPIIDQLFGSRSRGAGRTKLPGLITPDDSPEFVRLSGNVKQIVGPSWRGKEEIEFVITEDGE